MIASAWQAAVGNQGVIFSLRRNCLSDPRWRSSVADPSHPRCPNLELAEASANEQSTQPLQRGSSYARAIAAWHGALFGDGGDPREGNPGMRAEIRRAATLPDVMMTMAFGRLLARASQEGHRPSAAAIQALASVALVSVQIPRLS